MQPNAPAVFLSGVAGPETNLPTVIRAANNLLATDSNPIHRGDDVLVIYTHRPAARRSGWFRTGYPAPGSPLAYAHRRQSVTLGNTSAFGQLYAGLAPGEVGVCQINVTVPGSTPIGWDAAGDQLRATYRRVVSRCE